MAEVLGVSFFIVLSCYWAITVGYTTGTVPQTVATFVTQGSLNTMLYLFRGLRGDELTYLDYGNRLAFNLAAGVPGASSMFTEGKQSWVWILAILTIFFGESIWSGLALNTFLLTTIPAILVAAGRKFGLFKSGATTAWLVAFAPPLLLWGNGLDREPLVFSLISVSILGASCFFQGKIARGLLLTIFSIVALSVSRDSLVLMVISMAFAFMLIGHVRRRQTSTRAAKEFSKRRYVGFILFVVFAFIPLAGIMFEISQSQTWNAIGIGIPELSGPEFRTSIPGASWENNTAVTGFFSNLVLFFFGPTPWQVTNFPLLFFSIEGLFYAGFFLALVAGCAVDKGVRVIVPGIAAGAAPIIIAGTLLLSNYGLNSRIRAHVFLLALVLIEPILSRLMASTRRIFRPEALRSFDVQRGLGSDSSFLPERRYGQMIDGCAQEEDEDKHYERKCQR